MAYARLQLRGDTAANWAAANPVLADREIAVETDTRQFKMGDGVTAWTALGYGGVVGPTGDVTPEAIAARDAAQEAASNAQEDALAAALSASAADGAAQARVQELRDDLGDPTGGAGLVAFLASDAGAVNRDLRGKVSEVISPGDYSGTVTPILSVRYDAAQPTTMGLVLGMQHYSAREIGSGSVLIGGKEAPTNNRLPGTRELRGIIGGYDNEITSDGASGGLACGIVFSHHSEIQGPATHATIVGGSYLKILDGDYNTISGGTLNTINTPGGSRCTIAGGSDNSISGAVSRATIGGGGGNSVTGSQATVSGGFQNTASGQQAAVIGGTGNVASGVGASVLGGANSTASGNYSAALGVWASAANYGEYAQSSGRFAAAGDAQTSVLTLRRTSINTVPVAMRPDGGSTFLVVPDNTTWAFSALVVARRTDAAGESAAYRVEGVVSRDAGAGTIAFIGTPAVTPIGEADAAWSVTVTVNTTQGALEINGVGAADKNIRWVARLEISQVKS